MHPFRAVQIQNAEDRWRIRLRPYSHQRHASNCAKIHRDNTGLLSISVIETFHHEYRGSVLDDIVDNSMTGFEVRLRQGVAFAIHAGGIAKILIVAHENESSFRAADFKRRFQNFLKRRFRREEGFPLILKVEDARNLFEV